MSKAIIKTADAENNNYAVDVPGYGKNLPAQCVTKDELSAGSNVNIIDQYNIPPDDALSFGNIRLLPNTGEHTYSTDKVWKTADELWAIDAKASLAFAFMFSCEKNPRWQNECPLYNIGTVIEIIDEKYMWVMCRNDVTRRCRTDYMTCDTDVFEVDDQVAVKFEDCDKNKPVVVGFWNEPKPCEFYIDITINNFLPAYVKTLKLIDANGMVYIKQSTSEEPASVGPFSNVAFPAKVYLYKDGNAPFMENDSRMLFSYFTANPVKEFTVVVETWVEGSTIAINGIVLGNGDQQKFSWDYAAKTWSPVSGGVDNDTTLFMTNKANPTSSGYHQACKKEIVNAYEGTRILLTHGDGNPQIMGDIYDYCFSAKKVHSTFHGCDTYRPYYGLVENLPIYGPPYETVVEDLYYLDAWRVAYLLMDDDTIGSKPTEPINFTASRLGSLMVKETIPPPVCGGCVWTVEEKSWGNIDDIKYNAYPNFIEYLIVAVMGVDVYGFYYDDTPHDCEGFENMGAYCGSYTWWQAWGKKKMGVATLPQMGIMTDSDGKNPVFNSAALDIDHTAEFAYQFVVDEGGDWVATICLIETPSNIGAKRYEFKEISTPEHRI